MIAETEPKARTGAAKSRTVKRIASYTVTRDGKPTRFSRKFPRFPYSILPSVLLESDEKERELFRAWWQDAEDRKQQRNWRRQALRECRSAIKRTEETARGLEESIHYDSAAAKAVGSYDSKYVIVRIYDEVTIKETEEPNSKTNLGKRPNDRNNEPS